MKKKIIFSISIFSIFCLFVLTSCNNDNDVNYSDPITNDKETTNSNDNNPFFGDNTENNSQSNNTSSTNNNEGNTNASNSGNSTSSTNGETINSSFTTVTTPSVTTPVEETVEKVYDSVVSINVIGTSFSASGSGVLFGYNEDLGLSLIVTCHHVIDGCNQISVRTSKGQTYEAKLVGSYSDEDLAVLSIEATGLTYASIFENSDDLKLGSQVVCIGNPLGTLPGSVSSGYLSYINREINVDTYKTQTLLQTDVAINSGNSGGGLFNTSGALIGIVNAKFSSSSIEGLGFAIPSKIVISTINEIMKTAKYDKEAKVWNCGYVEGDWEFGFTVSDGYTMWQRVPVVYVQAVEENTTYTGEKELMVNDIITGLTINYLDPEKTDKVVTISGSSALYKELYSSDLKLGDILEFTVTRSNESITISITVEQFIYSI